MSNRLLFVVNDTEFFISHRLPIARAAQKRGFAVHLAAAPIGDVRPLARAGIVFHPFSIRRGRLALRSDLRLFFRLFQIYREVRPDIVHHVTIKPVLFGGIAARFAGVPAVVAAVSGLGYIFIGRGLRARLRRVMVKCVYRMALAHRNSRVIFQNEDDRSLFLASGLVEEKNITMIKGSGVDLQVFAPTPEPPGPVIVLLASRLLWDKGVGEFVEAAVALKREGVQATFVLVGDNRTENPSRIQTAQLEEWQRAGNVAWWGYRDDMPEVFAAAHIVCLPSYREGLPKVLLEAAAAGRPIVTTDVPGCREVVRDGDNGLLVPARDSASLAMALRELIGNPGLRVRMGRRGRKIVEQEFSLEKIVGQTLETYTTLLAGRV